MNNKGFTLMELLSVLIIIGVIFVLVFNIFKGTFSMTESQMDKINDNRIFEAAKIYVLETNKSFNEFGYTCVNLSDLVGYGYLKYDNYSEKVIKVTRNIDTKVIENIEFVSECE